MKYNKEFNTNNRSELEKLLALLLEEFETENKCKVEGITIRRATKVVEYEYYSDYEHPIEGVLINIKGKY